MKIKELVIDAFGCKANLNNSKLLHNTMLKASKLVSAKVVKSFIYKYKPHDLSIIVLLAESHISIYTWPEYGYASIEIFLCNDKMDPYKALNEIKKRLEPSRLSVKEVVKNIK